MAGMMNAKLKKDKIRRREKPNKKWTEEEVGQVLNYLHEHPSFEMPSAQIFYKKLLLETGIWADWNLVRWKVRNSAPHTKKQSSGEMGQAPAR